MQSLLCKLIAPVAQNPAEPHGTEAAVHPEETQPSSRCLMKEAQNKDTPLPETSREAHAFHLCGDGIQPYNCV